MANPPSAMIYSADLEMLLNYDGRDIPLAIALAKLYNVPDLSVSDSDRV